MKIPKLQKRGCPKCKTHTEHKVAQAKKRTPGAARPIGRWSKARSGFGKGFGNLGRYGSRPPINKFKMTGKKTSKKTDLRYTCSKCNKTFTQNKGFRAKKVEFV